MNLGYLIVFSLTATSGLIGEVFYSGAVALLVLHLHDGSTPGLRDVFRKLPIVRLIAVDLLYAFIVLIGFILLIVPGLILMTWFWLAGALVEIEHCRPIAAFRRSRELIKGSFWRVFAVVIPLALITSMLSSLGSDLTFDLVGHSLLGEWLAGAIWDIVLAPAYALGVILVLVRLKGGHFDQEGYAELP